MFFEFYFSAFSMGLGICCNIASTNPPLVPKNAAQTILVGLLRRIYTRYLSVMLRLFKVFFNVVACFAPSFVNTIYTKVLR